MFRTRANYPVLVATSLLIVLLVYQYVSIGTSPSMRNKSGEQSPPSRSSRFWQTFDNGREDSESASQSDTKDDKSPVPPVECARKETRELIPREETFPDLIDFSKHNNSCFRNSVSTWPENDGDIKCWDTSGGLKQEQTLAMISGCAAQWSYTPDAFQILQDINGNAGFLGAAFSSLMSKGDYVFLDMLIAAHHDIKTITEFGTSRGGTSLYLGMVARIRKGEFYTTEYNGFDCRKQSIADAWLPNMHMIHADILATTNKCELRSKDEREGKCVPCAQNVARLVAKSDFLLADNGEKMREVALFAKYMRVGSVIAVHDSCRKGILDFTWLMPPWGFEPHPLERIRTAIGSCLQAFIRTKPGKGIFKPLAADPDPKSCAPFGYKD